MKAKRRKVKRKVVLPSVVLIGPHRYHVVYADQINDADSLGLHQHDDLTITIKNLPHGQMRLSLLHEIMHAAFELVNGHPECFWCHHEKKFTEESWVTSVSPILLDVLIRNPAVVDYLLGVETVEIKRG